MANIRIEGIKELQVAVNEQLMAMEEEMIAQLSFIGEKAVTIARQPHTANWTDRTGNLRSSIGYMVLKDGQPVIMGRTERHAGPIGDGSEGEASVEPLLSKLASEHPTGYTLILCAGMEYASYVEELHYYDVLTSARLLAEQLVNKLAGKN